MQRQVGLPEVRPSFDVSYADYGSWAARARKSHEMLIQSDG